MRRAVVIAFTVSAVFLAGWAGTTPALAERPNVVFLLSDDQRPDTIAALGNKVIETPALDSLVRRGTTFTRAHSPNPLCVPSRVEILTGCHGFINGVRVANRLDESLALWPRTMANAGYETCYVGKWHTTGRPSTRGYQSSLGLFSSGGGKFWNDHVDFKGTPVTGYRGWIFQTDDRTLFPEYGVGLTGDISARFADAAIEFIGRKHARPYFLQINFTAPHDPLVMPPGYEDKYPPESIPLPRNYREAHPFDHGNYRGRDEKMLPWPRTTDAVRNNLAMYYRVISHMDHQIGRILQAIEQSGDSANTLIIFSSDHGLAVGSHGLMGKQNMYDHTVLVPMILAGPGIPVANQTDALVYLRDLFPSICDLVGLEIPETVEAESFASILRGEERSRTHVFGYFRDSQRMVRSQRWKLVFYPHLERYQLFNTVADPDELDDLIARPEHQATFQSLKTALEQWQREVDDPVLDASR